jgi:hypothetical protein
VGGGGRGSGVWRKGCEGLASGAIQHCLEPFGGLHSCGFSFPGFLPHNPELLPTTMIGMRGGGGGGEGVAAPLVKTRSIFLGFMSAGAFGPQSLPQIL